MQVLRVIARTDAALTDAGGLVPLGGVSVGISGGGVKGEHAVALLRGGEVMGAVDRLGRVVHLHVPGALEPLVLPGEEQSSAAARFTDIPRHPRIQLALLLLGQTALLIAVDAGMRDPARGAQPVLRDQKRDCVLRFQLVEVGEVVILCLGICLLMIHELGIVGVDVHRREQPGVVVGQGLDLLRINALGVLLLGERLGGMAQGVERLPVQEGNGYLAGIGFALMGDQRVADLTEKGFKGTRTLRGGEILAPVVRHIGVGGVGLLHKGGGVFQP